MLGMMMDFLRDSIDPVFAKGMLTIYNSTTSVIMGIAAVVAIAQLFQENKDSENDKEEEKPLKRCAGELFLVVAIIFFCYGEYCKLHYYEVPNINFYDSYEKVENEISAPGSIADIVYDEAANQRENEDVEESDGEFKVYGINYVPGSLIYHRMGEKVDIIKYSDDPAEYIAAALAPADVVDVRLAEEGKACRVIVPDDQLSLAIGKEGQNARLAARLVGYKIDIKPKSYKDEE